MPDLRLLESSTGDPHEGGLLITWPDNTGIEVAWRSDGRLIQPTLQAAKRYAAEVITELQKRGNQAAIDSTNWASMVASIQAHLITFNGRLSDHIRNTMRNTQH
jgi:hypothetical protein